MDRRVTTIVLSTILSSVISQRDVTLTTNKGPIVGLRWDPNPSTGVSYDSYLGVPYGKVTRRFQAAVPPARWNKPLVTQTDGPPCPQRQKPYNEDCLYLNVFTPVNAPDRLDKLAVMVFIYGGGFLTGNSSSKIYGPDWLVAQDVVLVTFNYRVGALGFLTLGSKLAPGNQGLYDCVLALQWVREEISAFGGDPTQVTVMGGSAGAVLAQILYLSPYSTGLVARAISHSGSVLAGWSHVTPAVGGQRARQLGEALHCPTDDDAKLLACLQMASVQDIVNKQAIELPFDENLRGNFLPFVPVLDSYKMTDQPFFNNSLDNLMEQAVERDKQLLLGFNSEDGAIIFATNIWNQTEKHLLDIPPKRFSDTKRANLANKIASRYFPDVPDLNKIHSLTGLYTHIMFSFPIIKMANQLGPVTFGYIFAHEGTFGIPPAYATKYKITGAKHGDELNYIFFKENGSYTSEVCPSNKPNLAVRDQMVKWWTTFAKTGIPDSSWSTVFEGSYQLIKDEPSKLLGAVVESKYYNFWAVLHSTPSSATGTLPSLVEYMAILSCITLRFSI